MPPKTRKDGYSTAAKAAGVAGATVLTAGALYAAKKAFLDEDEKKDEKKDEKNVPKKEEGKTELDKPPAHLLHVSPEEVATIGDFVENINKIFYPAMKKHIAGRRSVEKFTGSIDEEQYWNFMMGIGLIADTDGHVATLKKRK